LLLFDFFSSKCITVDIVVGFRSDELMLQQILFILTRFGMDLFGLIEPIQPLPVGLFPHAK